MSPFRKALIGTASSIALLASLSIGAVAADPAADTEAGAALTSIALDPTTVPAPIARDHAATIKLELQTIEREAELADGTTFRFWTFNGTVPGPFVRARVGDTIDVAFSNAEDSTMFHSVDFHAVTGPGGGAVATQTAPGEHSGFSFKALNPGIYVYHCATPMVADHIQAGMYGLILVEPEGGLPPVDRELYVMQGEVYTELAYGEKGEAFTDYDKLLDEKPEYYVFNGAVGALAGDNAIKAKTGETVRIYFGVGGPNKTSSFHVIGEIMDKVYTHGSLTSPASLDVQTVTVAPGGATVAEVTFDVPGRYLLVDHALSRLERGLVAMIEVEGPADTAIFNTGDAELSMAGH
ncbi:nitrite reductase, copper-containing [Parvibaculum lavamentivorans DS-1]|uniref:Copper-containing nitrite reductase n=1 Tax=Parvibaculum lavamentivorans (strain DS-1 / DSM 13023 / NCIMB 13966) TaxID=402881 RepID=A7HRU9_PARL1|nr:copper-containing nitrite reductase [Parvibaculum lavamentivorans]ABS62632.1 nitrite reductase, copper-containing [Parvibaculum lavamentivorans DS-1]